MTHPLSEYMTNEMASVFQRQLVPISIARLVTISQVWKQPKCVLLNKRMNKLVEYYCDSCCHLTQPRIPWEENIQIVYIGLSCKHVFEGLSYVGCCGKKTQPTVGSAIP